MTKKLKVWNLETQACMLTEDFEIGERPFHTVLFDENLFYLSKNVLCSFNLKTLDKKRWAFPVNDSTANFFPTIKSVTPFQGRLLVKTDQGFSLLNLSPEEKRVNYLAKINDLIVLKDQIIYTHIRKRREKNSLCSRLFVSSAETDIRVLNWDKEHNCFQLQRHWRLPHDTGSTHVTPDRVMLYRDLETLYALDLDRPDSQPVALWQSIRYVHDMKIENNILSMQLNFSNIGSDIEEEKQVYQYQLTGLKTFLTPKQPATSLATHQGSLWNNSPPHNAGSKEEQARITLTN